MRRAYIDTVKELRALGQDAVLVQNGGFDLLLNRENVGNGSECYVDAVMHEVATTRDWQCFASPAPALDPTNYSSWRNYYRTLESQGQTA